MIDIRMEMCEPDYANKERVVKIKLENGRKITPKDHHEVFCETHNFRTTWGKLGPLQQLALSESLDIDGPKCIFSGEPE